MHTHPDDNLLFQYISAEISAEHASELETHTEECDGCFEKLRSLIYLKRNFFNVWQTLSLDEIMHVERGIEESQQSDGVPQEPVRSFSEKLRGALSAKRRVMPVLLAAAAVILIIMGNFASYFINSSKMYNHWVAAGVIERGTDLNRTIGRAELDGMLSRLAGAKVSPALPASDALSVKDGADAIKNAFNLEQEDRNELVKGLREDAALTGRNALKLIDKFAGELYSAQTKVSGRYRSLAVNTGGAILRDADIKGNLYLLQGIGEGEATLQNVKVAGKIYVLGGGMSSVILENASAEKMVVHKDNGRVRIFAKEGTVISSVILSSGAKLQIEGQAPEAFRAVKVTQAAPEGSELRLDGRFPDILVDAGRIKVNVENGVIGKLELSKNAAGAQVYIAKTSTVEKLTVNAPATVKGPGLVKTLDIRSRDVKLDVGTEKSGRPDKTDQTEKSDETGASDKTNITIVTNISNKFDKNDKTNKSEELPASSGTSAQSAGSAGLSAGSASAGGVEKQEPSSGIANPSRTDSPKLTESNTNLNDIRNSEINISNSNVDNSVSNSNNTANNYNGSQEITNKVNNSSATAVGDMDTILKQIEQQKTLKNKAMVDIKYIVTDRANNKPIKGAVVFVNGQANSLTDENGVAAFSVYPYAVNQIKVAKDGYTPYQENKSYSKAADDEVALDAAAKN